MLKKFFLNTLSSFVGAWLAFLIFAFAAVIIVVASIGKFSTATAESVTKHSILKISLQGELAETETSEGLDYIEMVQGNLDRPQTLNTLSKAISEAKTNKNIEAIYIECGGVSAAPATLNALREKLSEFKESGKRIYAYGDAFSMGDYYVASVADSLFLNKAGSVQMNGISGTSIYMKDFFDKIGVQFQVVKVGTFKSAVEPYISNEMSQPARAQLDTLYGVMWNTLKEQIATSRKIKTSTIDSLINRDYLPLQDAAFVVKNKLVDKAIYGREMNGVLANLVGVDREKLNFVSPSTLVDQTAWGSAYSSNHQIAVLYATGEIMEGSNSGIDCATLVPIITELADNDKVDGLVLRVNSPGGSVFGSEQIGEALDYFKSKKPLAVSMGDYAASGGYWISCGADRIYADPLTITGSIGIFGLIPNVEGLAGKLGLSPQTVSTNPQANFPNMFAPLTEAQHAAMQKYVEAGYDKFVNRVAKGRNMSVAKVKSIAEGRVWSAVTAKEIGLVDALGSLQDAINWVATRAQINDKYEVSIYPIVEPSIWDAIAIAGEQGEAMVKMCRYINETAPDKMMQQAATMALCRNPYLALMPKMRIRL